VPSVLPFLDIEVMLVLQGAPQHRRELMERLEQLARRVAQRFLLEAVVAGAMSSRIACSEREATIGSLWPSMNTLVR